MDIAKVDCSDTRVIEDIFGGGTGMYALIREALDCF